MKTQMLFLVKSVEEIPCAKVSEIYIMHFSSSEKFFALKNI